MNTTELMIGDWVNVYCEDRYENGFYRPGQIRGINGDEICFGDNSDCPWYMSDDYDTIRPIPLTKEVLEKNSFLKVEAIEYPSHSVGISFLYRDTSEGLRIFVQNACVGGPTCTMIKTCKYVHEVQHMIKMCDIEKEIEL